MMKNVAPSAKATAFDCPYCGAYTTQTWYESFVKTVERDDRLPSIWSPGEPEKADFVNSLPAEDKGELLEYLQLLATGEIKHDEGGNLQHVAHVSNLNLSKCYNCAKSAVWRHLELVFPIAMPLDIEANADLPPDAAADFREAAGILNISPRGSAALSRLCLQKLLPHIGGKGKNINSDIALLVSEGLDPRIQKALDVVRVVGNNAVHPGEIDLKDNKAVAATLLRLINQIVDQTITQKNEMDDLFEGLPDGALRAIEKRDGERE